MKTIYSIRLGEFRLAIADVADIGDGYYLITRINVPNGHRSQGLGSELLRQVLEDADAEGVNLMLEIQSSGDLDYDQLREWYVRNGFKESKVFVGRLVREPNTGECDE